MPRRACCQQQQEHALCSDCSSASYLVGAMGEYSRRPPDLSLMAVMRTVVATLMPTKLCSCSNVQICPGTTCTGMNAMADLDNALASVTWAGCGLQSCQVIAGNSAVLLWGVGHGSASCYPDAGRCRGSPHTSLFAVQKWGPACREDVPQYLSQLPCAQRPVHSSDSAEHCPLDQGRCTRGNGKPVNCT